MSLPSFNFLHLTVSEIEPGQDFQTQGHYSEGQRSNQDHTMALHTYTYYSMSNPNINFLLLSASEIQAVQSSSPTCLIARPHPDNMGENNTPTALKGFGVIKLN